MYLKFTMVIYFTSVTPESEYHKTFILTMVTKAKIAEVVIISLKY